MEDENTYTEYYKSVSISTAVVTLAYARIHITKIKLYILNRGGKLYYTDSDSVITNLKLPQQMVHRTDLGKLKL